MIKQQIIQIIPAPGWFAEYENPNQPDIQPLACWALVQEGDGANVIYGAIFGNEQFQTLEPSSKNFIRFVKRD